MARLTDLKLAEGKLTLIYDPDANPPTSEDESQKLSGETKGLFALFALIFLLTLILFFILMSRRKKLQK